MARAQINATFFARDKKTGFFTAPVGASVDIVKRGTAVAPTLYDSESGGNVVTDDLVVNAQGKVRSVLGQKLWCESSALTITATLGSNTYQLEYDAMTANDIGGRELGSAEITADSASISAINPSMTDVSGLAVTVTPSGNRPIIIRAHSPSVRHSADQGVAGMSIREGSTQLNFGRSNASGAGKGTSCEPMARIQSPGSSPRTFKVSGWVIASGTCTIGAAADAPAFIQVVEV